MSENTPEIGSIGWQDLTVPNAAEVRDFYARVVGWATEPLAMKDEAGDYADFTMNGPASGKPIAGVCHARGPNANLPPVWLVYITVADLEQSVSACREMGGKVLEGPRSLGGYGDFAVIEDPAGAVAAIYQPAAQST